jgi:guanylate kinase
MPDSTSIFILPPTRAALEQRLHERRTDSPETIARRLADASTDMSHYNEFDFVVVNDRFEKAAVDVDAILDGGGRELRANRADLKPLIETLVR